MLLILLLRDGDAGQFQPAAGVVRGQPGAVGFRAGKEVGVVGLVDVCYQVDWLVVILC